MVLLPAFAHKVTSTVTVKEEMKGAQNPNMELVWDDKSKSYKLQYISNTEQRTIFDKDASWNQDGEDGQEAIDTDPEKTWMNVPQLPGEVADEGALPGEVADETALPGEVADPDEEEADYEDFRPADMPEDEEDFDDDYGYEEPEE